MKTVYIVAAKRTPIGGFMGSLAGKSATELGASVIRGALDSISFTGTEPDSVYMGNVLSAGLGQSPARQSAIFAGVSTDKDATTVNKVCASGMKATILGAQQIQLGNDQVVITGGMESMSNVPHYAYLRNGLKLGNIQMTDGMTHDGLWDVYHDFHMGNAAEIGIEQFGLTREQLDEYALLSYHRAQMATDARKFQAELIPQEIQLKKETSWFQTDEDIYKVIPEKVPQLKPAFEKTGKLTAANSSNINDGAAALILASEEAVKQYGLQPLARIMGYADAAQEPELFTTSPALAIPKALQMAGISLADVDYFEINEAYSSVVLQNQQLLGYDLNKVNIYGGAVALGHPIGASGARILVTLLHVLQQKKGHYGVAAICNGGGGATALVMEKL